MKKNVVKSILVILFIVLLLPQKIWANESAYLLKPIEYTQEFKDYLKLSDEEKSKVMQPRVYEIPQTNIKVTNPLKFAKLKANLQERFSLKDIISNNVTIRNQEQTNSCWAFATIGALESTLALRDYYNGDVSKVYDFSERHMEYTTSRYFLNNTINEKGFNRNVGDGGNIYISEPYLINGYGAILEEDMPFENNENIIDISKIQNKETVTEIYDTIWFPTMSAYSITTEEINSIKEHIVNYGAIYAGIHGASGTVLGECYNNDTGALYCNNTIFYPSDHAVTIIGWDDNYNVSNFSEGNRPTNNGAWIAKNSWGEKIEYTLEEMKEIIFVTFELICRNNGWNEASEIPDDVAKDVFIENGYEIEQNKAVMNVGDHGYIYISYEDVNVYLTMWGIQKASNNNLDYDNIYFYNEYSSLGGFAFTNLNKVYLANTFNKKTNNSEYLTEVSLYAPETYICKVYVNPNGTSKAKNDLQLVALKEGQQKTIGSGYHTLEFLEPLEINGSSFSVVIEVQGTRDDIEVCLESKIPGLSYLDSITTESEKCFATIDINSGNNDWIDLSKLSEINSSLTSGDSTIRAFTTNTLNDDSLNRIQITTPPDKTSYFEGEDFDKRGMVVTAYYNNGESHEINDYEIENANNLSVGQTSVTITYEDKSAVQPIVVQKNSVVSIEIKTPPTKVIYKAGQDFNKSGMVVEATYKDGTKKIITDYEVLDGEDLKNGQTSVTIKFEDQTAIQEITVEPNLLMKIEITKAPDKTTYVVGQDFDRTGMIVKAIYEDGTEKEITSYSVENDINLQLNQTSVTISFEGLTVEQEIVVVEKAISSITIINLPTKTTYIQNKEELDLTGGKIKVTYNDNTYENIDMISNKVSVEGFSNENIGQVTVTLNYEGLSTTFNVTIIKEPTPENSDFNNSKVIIEDMKLYTYTDENKKEYALIKIKITDIVRNPINDSYEYYYYLSQNQNETNIEDWVKINDEQNDNSKLIFTINTKDITNYADLMNSENLYLYIEEVAIKGGNQIANRYGAYKLENSDKVEIYVDDVIYTGSTDSDDENSDDPTISDKDFPATGAKFVALFIVIGLFGVVLMYVKYKKYKDIR